MAVCYTHTYCTERSYPASPAVRHDGRTVPPSPGAPPRKLGDGAGPSTANDGWPGVARSDLSQSSSPWEGKRATPREGVAPTALAGEVRVLSKNMKNSGFSLLASRSQPLEKPLIFTGHFCIYLELSSYDDPIADIPEAGLERQLDKSPRQLGEDIQQVLHSSLCFSTGREGLHERNVRCE